MKRFLIAACFAFVTHQGQAQAQSISIRPERLMEGDGKTRSMTLEATVAPGGRLSGSVNYSSSPDTSVASFIPKFTVQDNSTEDRNPENGKIRFVLQKAFDLVGVYLIEVDEPRLLVFKVVHEPNNRSYFRQFVDRLIGAAGGGERGSEPKSARERIEEITNTKRQDKLAVWTATMPVVGQEVNERSLNLTIRSGLMPSWSKNGNYLACSTWRNGKWTITGYTTNGAGTTTQLWQWKPRIDGSTDFSPEWSPNDDAVAFVRLNQDQKSDVWILRLAGNHRPGMEVKLTNLGNVQSVLGWDEEIGLLFLTKSGGEGQSSSRQVWALKFAIQGKTPNAQSMPLSDAYGLVRGSAPMRKTLIYAQENDSPPVSVVYEMNSDGKRWPLLIGDTCSHKWPTISHDEKMLAFDSDCPR